LRLAPSGKATPIVGFLTGLEMERWGRPVIIRTRDGL
jgi:hypothetical protein